MSLEGSLETVALPEVLQLLSDTSKTGELLVSGDRGEGRLWFGAGRLTGFHVGRTEQAEDALFDLLRTGEGRFSFDADAVRDDDAHAVGDKHGEEVRPVLEVAQARLAEWTEIVAVVPSLQHVVSLAEEAPGDGVHLEPSQWTLVVAVGEGRAVQDILDRASLPEFDGCRSLKVLVDEGLASVSEPAAEIVEEPVAKVDDDRVAEEPVGTEAHEQDELTEPEAEEAVFEDDQLSHEAELDPDEYVFGSVPSSPELEDESADDLAPWSIQLDEAPSNGVEDGGYVPQPVPFPEAHTDEDLVAHAAQDSRAALEALIAEIPADDQDAETRREAPDGLADRGPWTSHELASLDQMGGWSEEEHHDEATSSHSFFDVEAEDAPEDRAEEAKHLLAGAREGYAEGTHDGQSDLEAEASDEYDDEEEPETKQPEPVNRGLLLKFLSSVRS